MRVFTPQNVFSNDDEIASYADNYQDTFRRVFSANKGHEVTGALYGWPFAVHDTATDVVEIGDYHYSPDQQAYDIEEVGSFLGELHENSSFLLNEHEETLKGNSFSLLDNGLFWKLYESHPRSAILQFCRMALSRFMRHPVTGRSGGKSFSVVVSHVDFYFGTRINKRGKILKGFHWRILERPFRRPRESKYILAKETRDGGFKQEVRAIKAKDYGSTIRRYRIRTQYRV